MPCPELLIYLDSNGLVNWVSERVLSAMPDSRVASASVALLNRCSGAGSVNFSIQLPSQD
jgi:hypothetical protein